MSETELYLRCILNHYPNLLIKSANINVIGQNNVVVEINDDFIFRFPKYQKGIEQLEMETQVLQLIQNYISLSIPCPLYINFANKVVGEVFVGYKMIPGEPLWIHSFQSLTKPEQQLLAAQLANFLIELHRIPITVLDTSKSSIIDISYWEKLYKRIKLKLFPYISFERQGEINKHFEMFLTHYLKTDIQVTLVHGDFGTSNILFKPTPPNNNRYH